MLIEQVISLSPWKMQCFCVLPHWKPAFPFPGPIVLPSTVMQHCLVTLWEHNLCKITTCKSYSVTCYFHCIFGLLWDEGWKQLTTYLNRPKKNSTPHSLFRDFGADKTFNWQISLVRLQFESKIEPLQVILQSLARLFQILGISMDFTRTCYSPTHSNTHLFAQSKENLPGL